MSTPPFAKRPTTVIEPAPATASVAGSARGPWKSVYAQAAAGTIDLAVQSTTIVNTPFGEREQQATALGSGFVLDGQGHLLTAAHVVDGGTSIRVAFQDGSTRSATIVGKDDASDVAVLHVDPADLKLHPISLGSSRALAVGDELAVIGDPLGFERSLSTGVVSGLDRTIEAPNGFQIATGTNEFGRATTETSTGVGFASRSTLIKNELARLEHGEHVSHAYLGLATGHGAGAQRGAMVGTVAPGGPAAKAVLGQAI